jgi:hypothetical protein
MHVGVQSYLALYTACVTELLNLLKQCPHTEPILTDIRRPFTTEGELRIQALVGLCLCMEYLSSAAHAAFHVMPSCGGTHAQFPSPPADIHPPIQTFRTHRSVDGNAFSDG